MPTWKQHYVEQADYQHWANEALFTSLDHLTAEAIEGDAGLFFKSIHHTTDHILMVSRLWFARLRGESMSVDWRVIHHPDWRELKMALRRETRQLQAWLEAQPEDWFAGEAEFTASDGKPRRMSVHDVLTHVFGHYQHHRGQVSAACTRLGAPCPEMDFVYYRRAVEKLLGEVQPATGR